MLRPIKLFSKENSECPDDFRLSVFAQGTASSKEQKDITAHLSLCSSCREVLTAQERISVFQSKEGLSPAPEYLKGYAKDLLRGKKNEDCADILIKFNEKMMTALRTQAEIISGIRISSEVAFRGKGIETIEGHTEGMMESEKSSTQTLLLNRIMGKIRFEIEVIRKNTVFQITLQPKSIRGLPLVDRLRVSLKKNFLEIESRVTSQGQVCFESLEEGPYSIEVHQSRKLLGRISLRFVFV